MKCPIDNTNLQMSERQGVEIDYCPECRGVWLDRGELDKLIEKSESSKPASNDRDKDSHYDRNYDHKQSNYKHKKRESFLGDLFDF